MEVSLLSFSSRITFSSTLSQTDGEIRKNDITYIVVGEGSGYVLKTAMETHSWPDFGSD